MDIIRYWRYGSNVTSHKGRPQQIQQPLSGNASDPGALPNWLSAITLERPQRRTAADSAHSADKCSSSNSNSSSSSSSGGGINNRKKHINGSKNSGNKNDGNGSSSSAHLPEALLPFPCHCAMCADLMPAALGQTMPAAVVSKRASPPRNKPGRPKGSLTKRKREEPPKRGPKDDTPMRTSVAVLDHASNTYSFRSYDSIHSPEYLAQQLRTSTDGGGGGGFRRMLVGDDSGAEWGLFSLLAGAEKPMRYTHACHYVFAVLYGAAYVTLGSRYAPVRQRAYVTPGFVFEVPRGNFYAVANAQAKAPVTLLFVKASNMPQPAAAAAAVATVATTSTTTISAAAAAAAAAAAKAGLHGGLS